MSSDNIICKPFMGVVEVNHYLAESPQDLYGSDMPSVNITELAVYQGARCLDTKKVVKRELLYKVKMSDYQFGMMVARPNFGDGARCTKIYEKGKFTPDFHAPETTTKIQKEMASLLAGGSSQVSGFIDETIAMVEESVEAGRMKKSVKDEVLKKTGMLATYLKNNETFYAEQVSGAAKVRVNEIKNSIHRTIQLAESSHVKALGFEAGEVDSTLPETTPKAFMNINIGGSSGVNMFDESNVYNGVVSIEFSDADTKRSSGREGDERSGCEHTRLLMSPTQYARLLRADRAMVPVTLTRVLFEDCELPKGDSVDASIVGDLSAAHEHESYHRYVNAMNHIRSQLIDDGYRGKKGLVQLLSDMTDAKALLEDYLAQTKKHKVSAVKDVLKEFEREVHDHALAEIERLPEYKRDHIMRITSNLTKHLVGLPNKVDHD